jgi:uncharacterized protein (TIGR02246 family)
MADQDAGAAVVVTTNEEAAIRSLLTRSFNAWARGDGAAYAQCFAEPSDYITFNGDSPSQSAQRRADRR